MENYSHVDNLSNPVGSIQFDVSYPINFPFELSSSGSPSEYTLAEEFPLDSGLLNSSTVQGACLLPPEFCDLTSPVGAEGNFLVQSSMTYLWMEEVEVTNHNPSSLPADRNADDAGTVYKACDEQYWEGTGSNSLIERLSSIQVESTQNHFIPDRYKVLFDV